jgi:DNA helicase-2/ATP-dependent DNA helicase PcrA
MIANGDKPQEIVAISFSRKSRLDLQQKWKRNHSKYDPPIISTIHSLGLLILRKYLKQTDFKLIRPNEQMRLIKFLLEESGAKVEDMKKELFAVLNEITFYKSNNVDIETIEELEHAREISLSISYDQFVDIFKAYEKHNEEQRYYDYDDLVYKTYRLLKANPDVLKKVRSKMTKYFVDESQDLNVMNWELVMMLCEGLTLVSVGDLCQNIYTFRYAKPEYFSVEYFEQFFSKVKNIQLPFNYRSTEDIVKLGNIIRAMNEDELQAKPVKGPDKHSIKVYTEKSSNSEGVLAIRIISQLLDHGYKPSDITVICRSTNFINTVLERHLIEKNFPYQILAGNNVSFHESNAVNIFMSMIGVLADPKNMVAFTTLIPYMNGMGEFKRLKGGFESVGKNAQEYIKLILKLRRPNVSTGKSLDAKVMEFYNAIVSLRVAVKSKEPFTDVLAELYEIHFKFIKDRYRVKNSQFGRIRGTVMNFINDYLDQYKTKSLKDALCDLVLNVTSYDPENDGDVITLSTVHAQKGLESKVSIVCGFRTFNVLQDLGDEKNIMYVQLSRAIEKLILIRSRCLRKANASVIEGKENPHITALMEMWEASKQEQDELWL